MPAEAPIPQAEGGVDDAVVEPAGEEGAVDAGNGGRAPVSGIRQCSRLLPGLRCGGQLRRQQADAIISAREKIVDGAVSMVKMALDKLKDEGVVDLDEERKAAMVSNLLVVLCGDEPAQPVVNSGSLY